MQRESLMLSRLRLNWKVILENHFPSLMGASFFVSTSRPCALYFQSPSSFLAQHLSPHPRQAGRIRRKGTVVVDHPNYICLAFFPVRPIPKVIAPYLLKKIFPHIQFHPPVSRRMHQRSVPMTAALEGMSTGASPPAPQSSAQTSVPL